MQTAGEPTLGGLVAWESGHPALVGGACSGCGTRMFPASAACPRCGAATIESVGLPTSGTVWSWTVQRFAPKPPFRVPDPFEPYTVAYVDLGPVKVESRLTGRPVDAWAIGDEVRLTVLPLPGEAPSEPSARWTFAFEPSEAGR